MEERRVLDSWKEIAAYLGRSVKTCRRWEHELGLPIHRLEESPKARVFAYPEELDQWIKTTQKSETAIEIPLPFYQRKPLIFYLSFFAVCAIVITFLVWRPFPKKQVAKSLSEKPSLAILYFDNLSNDKNLDPWKTGLTELLITSLSQSKFIDVLASNTIYSILKKLNMEETQKYTREDLIKIMNEGKATHTLSGSIIKAGGNIIITISLQNPQAGKIIRSIPLECRSEEEIIPKIDEISRQIKADMDISPQQIALDIDQDLSKITTASAEAFKYYSQGRDFHKKLNFEQSIALMEKAITLDPGFAMAYRSLSLTYYDLNDPAKGKGYIQKAFELSDRISDRERYLILGDYYRDSEATFDKAIEALTRLLELYPDDPQANASLGWIYHSLEDWDKAIELYEANTKQKVPDFISYAQLTNLYEITGLYQKAVETMEDYIENFSENESSRLYLSSIRVSQGKFDLALAEAKKAYSLNPTFHYINTHFGYIYLLKGDYREAEKEFQNVIETANEDVHKFQATEGLVFLYLLEGKFRKSKEQIQKGIELSRLASNGWYEAIFHDDRCSMSQISGDFISAIKETEKIWEYAVESDNLKWQRRALWKRGLCYVGLNEIERAQKIADELKAFIEKGINKKAIRLYFHLQGMIDFEKKNFPKSIEFLNKSVSSLSSQYLNSDHDALFYDSLASAYLKAGDFENAKIQYEAIIALTWGRYYWGDIYAKSFYMLGRIYEQQGNKAKAWEHYKKFLELWKDADPGIAEVEDAKGRLAKLKNL